MQGKPLRRAMLLVALLLAAAIPPACGTSPDAPSKSDPPPTPTPGPALTPAPTLPPAPTPTPSPAPTQYLVTIAIVGLDPFTLEVPVGARVTFLSRDVNFSHYFASVCPEIDAVGLLQFGQSGQTAPFTSSKTCSYYDRLYPENPLRQGKIVVR